MTRSRLLRGAWAAVVGLVTPVGVGLVTVVGPPPVAAAPAPARAVVAFACGQLSPKGPAAGTAVKVSAGLGDVRATLSGTAAAPTGGGISTVRHLAIDISVGGLAAFRAPLATPPGRPVGSYVPTLSSLVASSSSSSPGTPDEPLCVADFGGSHPETAVLIGFFSMGAHCCTSVDAYVVTPAGVHLPPVEQEIGNPGVELRSLGGHAVMVTADNSFAYEFTAYAFSGMPVRALELRGALFADTTKDYPALVAADAGVWWKYFEHAQAPHSQDPTHGTGALAPWVADECLLGHGPRAWATVARLNADGKLSGGSDGGLWPTGTTFVKDLRTFLVAHGYCGS